MNAIPSKEEVSEAILQWIKRQVWGGGLLPSLGDSRYWNMPADYAAAVVDWMIVRLHQADTGEIIKRLDRIAFALKIPPEFPTPAEWAKELEYRERTKGE